MCKVSMKIGDCSCFWLLSYVHKINQSVNFMALTLINILPGTVLWPLFYK